ncbi:hypothetical protein SAMN05446037_100139 [Anaerovirgula multivorans]|uniref:PcfK-like protein n=1 Tax=Anaerovirgula multivorans TaxID=312168 RepID=A0A238ZRE3_9FIRM|nr:hypothetical protein [Anaerovirgula multivorans]SNR85621.1 hypothetical protein SAMN05446037_100139 [Anaerovirgula multivorans]
MLEKAIEKIRSEVNQNSNNSYNQVIGELLLKHLNKNPEAAEKILAEGKTIAKSLDAMKKVAGKKKTGNFAMLTLEEGFKAVLDYYGIKAEVKIEVPEPPELVSVDSKPAVEKKKIDFDIKLEELL